MHKLLKQLSLKEKNYGASTSAEWWSHHTDEGEIESINPTNGEIIGKVYRASNKDYEHILREANHAFLSWRNTPAPKRGAVIHAIGCELRKHKDALGSLVSLEMGKSKQEGDGEVQEMIDMADLAVGQSRMLYGSSMHSERPAHRMFEQWHPLGNVLVISAFNFPVAVWAWNAFLAAICGNTTIWKPSPKTPLCALAVQHICNQVVETFGLRAIFSLFITDNNTLVKDMVNDNRIPLVSFTGSTMVGKEVSSHVAKRLGRCLLELSGNNAIIVDETANLNLAIPSIVFGAVGTAGQRCTTTRRLIVHDSIYEKVVNALIKAYQKVTIGDPLDTKNMMGPLIDQHAVNEFLRAVNDAKTEGGEVLVGGKQLPGPGFYVEPTLIAINNHAEVVQRETFGPILYILRYKTLEEAIGMQNFSRFGLSSAIFTNDLANSEAFLAASGSDCGIANVNLGTSGAEIGGAFGGEKDTGGGREAGSDAWKSYMRRQTSTINWGKTLNLAQGIKFDI